MFDKFFKNNKNVEKNAEEKTMASILGQEQNENSEKKQNEKSNTTEQMNDKNNENANQSSQPDSINSNDKEEKQDNQIKEQQKQQDGGEEDKNYLYLELAKKYNIPLDILEKQDGKKTSFQKFQEKKKQEQESQERQIQTQENVSETQQMIIQQRLAKRKHISSYKKKYEIDSYLQGSFLDKQDEDTPQVMRYMDNHKFQIDMNIGKNAGDMIKSAATSQMKHEIAMQRGKGFLWHAAKTGKLGIDLWLCLYGFLGTIIIPYYFYKDQQNRMEKWRQSKGIDKSVTDFEAAGFDLDDLSYDKSFENMYIKERKQEKEKRIELHSEIKFLVDYLMPNK